jgi:hypothetical protein
MPLSQTEYLWSGATPLLLISPARFFLYKGPKIDYFLRPPLDYRLLFALVSPAAPPRGAQLGVGPAQEAVRPRGAASRRQPSRRQHAGGRGYRQLLKHRVAALPEGLAS